MKINKYPDGTSYISEVDFTKVWKLNSYEDLWHLNQFVDAFNHKYKSFPTIIIPNLIDAQADKRFGDDQSSGLKLVCNFLNGMNANFKIFHPHNPEVVEALLDNVEIIDNSEFIKQVICNIGKFKDFEFYKCRLERNTILMSADAGGFKPLTKLCDNLNWKGETSSASKSRIYEDSKTKLTQILPSFNLDKDILIIDDISVYGGTFKGLSKAIKAVGHKGKLYLAVSHMTVQNLGADPVTNYFDKVFTTNSKFDWYGIANKDNQPSHPNNLEIIKMF